ncbi:MAG TPA: hypothetical protein VG052_13850 [Puia sp.]|jgi:glycosyltransferase involved in cell wall biosynthesis|nr:hypothetical protein [Puia sp.]
MFSKLPQIVLGALLSLTCYSQTQPLIVPKNVRLPTDSVRRVQLITSLNGFLAQASGPNKDNMFVQAAFLPETSALLDEMKGLSDPGADKSNVYRCYLTNVDWLDSSDYIVQVSYLGINDSTPVLKASFKLIAYLRGDRYVFRSPLRRNTATWHKKNTGKFVFYYTYPINEIWLNNYRKLAEEFDKKLGAKEYVTELYCCNTVQEGLEMLGVDYKLGYNGYSSLGLSSFEDDISLNILGTSNTDRTIFDLHDLWHDRLHHVIPVSTINKPIDEGCAYLYGGSWGLSWEEIFKQFKAYMGGNKDWLTAFTENKNFASSQQYHLYVSYVINALLAQKMEKEKGFPAVMEFLSCGKYEAGNDNYFRALDKIAGINRSNFNASVEKLVEDEQ